MLLGVREPALRLLLRAALALAALAVSLAALDVALRRPTETGRTRSGIFYVSCEFLCWLFLHAFGFQYSSNNILNMKSSLKTFSNFTFEYLLMFGKLSSARVPRTRGRHCPGPHLHQPTARNTGKFVQSSSHKSAPIPSIGSRLVRGRRMQTMEEDCIGRGKASSPPTACKEAEKHKET